MTERRSEIVKRWLWIGALAALAMVMAVGCGGGGEEGNEATGAEQQAAATPTVEQAAATPTVERGPKDVILATTTSVQDTGLLDVLSAEFEKDTGYNLKPIAVGTGQALAMGERGDADVMLVHAPSSEKELIDSGAAIDRRLVAHNYFVLLGPADDPAGVKSAASAVAAMEAIYDNGAAFISRGDDSGTNKKELSLWEEAGVDPKGEPWYEEAGQGMAATLQIANQRDAYVLCDRATYLSQKKNIQLDLVFEKDPEFLNVYSVMLVNPEKFDMVNAEGARAFADFLVSEKGQQMIGEFGVDEYGEQLFIPDADKTYEDLGVDP
jgi:tungstate transport system substrate-binding protein